MMGLLLSLQGASAATPAQLPMVGADEKDPWGVPIRTADKIALRRLLFERRFEELTDAIEQLQAISDKDCQRELVGLDAFEAFDSPDSRIEPLLEEWAKASPKSYAPLVARGTWGVAIAQERRGKGYASQTSDSQWRGMHESAASARVALDASIALHPTLAARRALMNLNTLEGTVEPPRASQLTLGLKACPASFQIHMKAIVELTPRWGGSYEQMARFAAKAPVKANPKLKVLVGTIASDRCVLEKKTPETALPHCEKALAVGPYWEFLYNKAIVLMYLGRHEEALAAVDKAIEQRPQKARVLAARASLLRKLGRGDDAAAALALLNELDPQERLP